MDSDTRLIENLQRKYETKRNGAMLWSQERDGIVRALEAITKRLRPRYNIVDVIDIGGTAIVLKLVDNHLGVPRALKFPRPIEGREVLLKEIIDGEIAHLVECTHPNIVSICDKGQIELNGVAWPYYVMEYLEGALDAQKWVEKNKPHVSALIRFLQQSVEGLISLHLHGTIHGDVKLENILVLPDGHAKLSDLGSARRLDSESDEETHITFTRSYAHPLLRASLSETSETDPNRVRGALKRSQLSTLFDIYALGRNVLRLLQYYDPTEYNLLPQYERRYLELMACRMLDGRIENVDNAIGLPDSVFQEIKYRSADEIALDLAKITGEYNLCQVVRELDHHFPRSIQVSQSQATPLTERVANLLGSPYIRRLGGISQLGLIVQIYPTATHSRLEHVLGCYSNVSRYIDALWHDTQNPFFRQVFTEHDVNVALLAALCHDIGHYPMAHDLEEADGDLFSHSTITSHILIDTSDADAQALRSLMRLEWEVAPEEVVAVLNTRSSDLSQPLKIRFLHSLIDGPLDADKLDYLMRDSLNLNVPYGRSIDFERLLRCLTVVFKRQADGTFITLGIHEKGKIPAEGLAFARYAMFGAVYWHHTSRSAKAMLHRAIWEIIPKWDRRSKEYRDLKQSFLTKVVRQGRLDPRVGSQGQLFIDKSAGMLMAETPQLAVSDYEMLRWVHQQTKPPGKTLIEMLCQRELFKRILVVSHRKNPALWDRLMHMRRTCSGEEMIAFQSTFQKTVVRLIDSVEDDKRVSTVMEKDFTDEIIGRDAQDDILFLVDIPGDRPGSVTGLNFLPEQRMYGPLTGLVEQGEMEDSVVWNSLSNQFAVSVGKIRVFCAPNIAGTCTACLSREDIEGALENAAAQTAPGT